MLRSVAAVSAKLWVRDTTRSLGTSPLVLALFGGVLLVVLAAGSVLLASMMPALPEGTAPPGALSQVRALSAALLWTVAGLLAAIFQLFAPRRTALSDVLLLLPVGRTLTAVAMQVPVLGVALLITVPLTSPTVTMLARAGDGGFAFAVPAALLLVLGLQLLVTLLFNLAVPLLARLRIPQHHALGGGMLVCLVVSLVPPVLELSGNGVSWLPHRALAAGADGEPAALGLLAVWCAGGVALFVAMAGRLPADPQPSPSRLFMRYGVPRGQLAARGWYELVVPARAPQYAAVVVFTAIVFAAMLVAWWLTESPLLTFVAAPLLLPFFFVSLQSYGHTRATHWLGTHLLARSTAWVAPKAAVTLAVAVSLWLPGAALAALAGVSGWDTLAPAFVQALPAWSAAMVAGLLVPYQTEQPLSVGLSMGVAGILYAGGLWVVGQLVSEESMVLGLLGLGCALTLLYLGAARTARPEVSHV